MKTLFTLLFISILFAQASFAQSQKTFVKSLNPTANSVAIDLEGKVAVNEWSETFIRITTTVEVTNFDEDILKRLVSLGRYSIEAENKDGVMMISIPKLATKVTIKGQVLDEVLTCEIFVPKGMTVDVVSKDVAADSVN